MSATLQYLMDLSSRARNLNAPRGFNLRRGLLRAWLVLTLIWVLSVLSHSAWQLFTEPPCYAFDSISLNDQYKGEDADFVQKLRNELLNKKAICGTAISTDLLSLEGSAKEGAILQVSFTWLEPNGWSTQTNATLDILENQDITASRIIGSVSKYVREARLRDQIPELTVLLCAPFLVLVVSTCFWWVAKGFAKP